jgi:hypothetical protein
MELSGEQIHQIASQVAAIAGEKTDPAEISIIVGEVIKRLENPGEQVPASTSPENPVEKKHLRKLIINAFGVSLGFLGEKITGYATGKALRITDISITEIDSFTSLIAIIDYSDCSLELNQVKFDLEQICFLAGFKAIVQDSGYYAAP